VRTTRFWNNTH